MEWTRTNTIIIGDAVERTKPRSTYPKAHHKHFKKAIYPSIRGYIYPSLPDGHRSFQVGLLL
jgi:hypothetical protein